MASVLRKNFLFKMAAQQFVILILFFFVYVNSETCSTYTNCAACASAPSWVGGCRWCELDHACHALGSLVNQCHFYDNIDNPKYCSCNGTPKPGYDKSVCTWYTRTNGGNDPNIWAGGDFLGVNYRVPANCACSGGDDLLWNTAAASCVRTYLLNAHVQLNNTYKVYLHNSSWPLNILDAAFFYEMHVNAYKSCFCPGTPAPLPMWYALFFGGAVLPCNGKVSVTMSILEFGRCGCKW